MNKIRVAIDVGALTGGHAVRGVGFYTRHLVDALVTVAGKRGMMVEPLDFKANKAKLSSFDLVHYPYFDLFFASLPPTPSTKMVVTVHDVIPLIYPEHYPPGIKGRVRLEFQKLRLAKAAAVITDSETSKKDIVRFLGIPAEKIYPIHLAPAEHFSKISDQSLLQAIRTKYNLPEKFVLYVGDVNYNKNILGLIKACKIAKTPLAICGKQALEIENAGEDLHYLTGPRDWLRFILGQPHPELAHYESLLKAFSGNKNIFRLGFVPDEDLIALFNLATVYCQPSFYEGFGLPVLEAMACGTPVVAAKIQVLVEIAEGAALFADPKNPKDIAQKLSKFFKDSALKEKFGRLGIKHAAAFSWKKTAQKTVEVYKLIAGNSPHD